MSHHFWGVLMVVAFPTAIAAGGVPGAVCMCISVYAFVKVADARRAALAKAVKS